MDFHSLTRRDLQNLCKKNKIPANITNVAMVDALKTLEIVEGIEEFLKPSESETAQSSIEYPEKMEVTSPTVPRTGGRSACRKQVSNEPKTLQTLTRTRRSTRKLAAGDIDEGQSNVLETPAVPNSRRRVAEASARRKIDTQFKEIGEDQKTGKGKKDVPETPAMMPDSRQRGLKGESMVRRVYSTRRSARLAEKSIEDLNSKAKERFETVKTELFPKDIGEILEMNVKGCSDNPGEVSESAGIDLKEESEERLDERKSTEAVSDIKSDVDNQTEFECDNDEGSGENFEVVKSNIMVEQDRVDRCDDDPNTNNDLKAIARCEIYKEIDLSGDIFDETPEMANKVLGESGSGDLFMTKSESIIENEVEMFTGQNIVSNDIAIEDVEKEVIEHESGFWISMTDINDGEEENNESCTLEVLLPKADEQEVNRVTSSESMTVEINNYLPDECIANNLRGEPIAPKLNNSALIQGITDACLEQDMYPVKDADLEAEQPVPIEESSKIILGDYAEVVSNFSNHVNTLMQWDNGDKPNHGEEFECVPEEDAGIYDVLDSEKPLATLVPAADVTGDTPDSCLTGKMLSSLTEAELVHIIPPTSLMTPVKMSSSKNPVKKSVSKIPNTTTRMSHVLDNKENIDNGGKKLILLTKEKKKNEGSQSIDYSHCSLRWLTKEFKQKLVITKNLNQNENGNEVPTSRPALQTLPENRPAAGEQ